MLKSPPEDALNLALEAWELKGYSKGTRKLYAIHVSQMLEKLGKPQTVTIGQLRRYLLDAKRTKELSNSTIYSKVNAIKAFFAALEEFGEIEENPAKKLDLPKRRRKLPVYLDQQEIDALLRVSQGNEQDHCLIEFLYGTGVRISEALTQ